VYYDFEQILQIMEPKTYYGVRDKLPFTVPEIIQSFARRGIYIYSFSLRKILTFCPFIHTDPVRNPYLLGP